MVSLTGFVTRDVWPVPFASEMCKEVEVVGSKREITQELLL